ncbi:trimeric intracellular cation channel family protein [Pseudonocardia sp. WMMC193]|uniref:trimeric intracellular cation channel family protein n=1 Tax=Pseudonocardia sp. WMMC193 TaxID=2911965 RepID=UPI001F3F0CEE|nr:TRIC cation channel family protein [Pseudonocardia sp. WMMC193]MCF7547814.1 TRIC cation channel family protein [Pseudonocardia sp. WMMC193]
MPAGARLIRPLDLAGTALFALQGGATAAAAGLDVFGVLVIAFVTAVGGGIVRDVLLGATPPAVFSDLAYPVAAFGGGLVVVLVYRLVRAIPPEVLLPLDAAALALFAVVGAAKAVDHGMSPLLAALLGAVSGTGGGVIRDVMLGRVPLILRSDVYAVAALAGAAVVAVGLRYGRRRALVLAAGFVVCFLVRMLAVWQGWNLPRVAG